jgi:hypothetical protein
MNKKNKGRKYKILPKLSNITYLVPSIIIMVDTDVKSRYREELEIKNLMDKVKDNLSLSYFTI